MKFILLVMLMMLMFSNVYAETTLKTLTEEVIPGRYGEIIGTAVDNSLGVPFNVGHEIGKTVAMKILVDNNKESKK